MPKAYPDTDLGNGLRNLARMLGAGFGTRIAALSIGGFDTHDAQLETHTELLTDLSDSLSAWQADLEARALSGRSSPSCGASSAGAPRTTTASAPTTAPAAW